MPKGCDRERDAETEANGDAERRDRVGADVVEDGDTTEAEKEEEERSERFRAEAHAERLIHVQTSVGVGAGFRRRRARFLVACLRSPPAEPESLVEPRGVLAPFGKDDVVADALEHGHGIPTEESVGPTCVLVTGGENVSR